MADGRKGNGCKPGENRNQGRKSKNEEQRLMDLIESAYPSKKVIKKLGELCEKGNVRALQIYMNYRFGKPHEHITLDEASKIIITHV